MLGLERAYPTEGKYTQDGGSHGLGPVHTPQAEYLPPVPASPKLVEDKSQVVPFLFQDHPVRAMAGEDGEPWFVAADVCAALDHSNPTMAIRGLDDDEKAALSIAEVSSNGTTQRRSVNVISEAGVYQLVFTSRKPEAKEFTRWVKRTVLPAIRKHGGYLTPQATEQALNDPDFIISLATKLKEERAKSAELAVANARIQAEKVRIVEEKIALEVKKQELTHDNAVLKPKATLHDVLMDANGSITINEAAKILNEEFPALGANGLFSFLRRKGVLMYNLKKNNVPTQAYMNKGYFRVAQKTSVHNETVYSYSQTYVKPLGMRFIYHLLENSFRYRGSNRAA